MHNNQLRYKILSCYQLLVEKGVCKRIQCQHLVEIIPTMRTKLLPIVIFAVVILPRINRAQRPCDPKTCLSSLTQKDCPKGKFIVPNEGVGGCCPGCRGGSTTGPCDKTKKCAPGLQCSTGGRCVLDKSTCAYTYHLTHLRNLPVCEVDGTFAAVQCKGDRVTGRCFCYSENGKRIFGWAWWRKSKDMTCACSRMKYKLIENGDDGNTLHCDEMGNFEPLQCNKGVCWCADPQTGEVIKGTRAVPESMWTYLPCYDIAEMGLQYLRQCESAAYAQHLLRNALITHGTSNVEFTAIQCDYDGSYGAYTVEKAVATCLWRDGTKLGFQTPSNKIAQMNCNCARDQKIFKEEGLVNRLICDGNGNYRSVQDINGKMFCVDQDGFAVSDPVQTNDPPPCSKYIYYETKDF